MGDKKSMIKNKNKGQATKGQATVEMVLILTILLGISFYLKNELITGKDIFVKFITTPWTYIGGMMESGVWAKKDDAQKYHPNQMQRMWTVEGESS